MQRANNRTDGGFFVKLLRNVFLVLLLIVFISSGFNTRNKRSLTETALLCDAVDSTEIRGVFFREEYPVTFDGGGVISYNVADGGKLGQGTMIAEIYSSEEQIAVNREIDKLQNKLDILLKIQNPGTQESAQPASLSASIEECYRNLIYSRDTRDYQSLHSDIDDLLVKMSTYQIITNEVDSFAQQITDINASLSELKKQKAEPIQTITSDRSAYFVSYCDGYENILNKDKLATISVAELSSVADRKSDDPTIVGKMIDGYGWYLAGIVDNSKKEFNIGDSLKLRFETGADMFDAVVTDIRDEGSPGQSIIVLECDQFNYDLVQHRAEKCELIKGTAHGLKVPRDAIRFSKVRTTVSYTDEGTTPQEEEITEEITAADDAEEETSSAGTDTSAAEETTAAEETSSEAVSDAQENSEETVTSNYKGVYIQKGEQVVFRRIDVIYEGTDYVISKIHDGDQDYLALYDDIMIEGVEIDTDE